MKATSTQIEETKQPAATRPSALLRNPHIPLTLRKKIGKMHRPVPGVLFRISLFGQVYEGKTGNHMDDKIYLYGLHEAATVRLIRAILRAQKALDKPVVYMDIGTNAGMHLTAVANLPDQSFGFEPWEKVRKKAQRNLELNDAAHIKIFDFGLSDRNATLPYRLPEHNNLGTGTFVKAPGQGTLSLAVRRGDEVMQEHKILPSLIKIDIEGHEKLALEGLRETLRACRPAVIFEYNDPSDRVFHNTATLHRLFGPGYSFHGILRSREYPKLVPFVPSHRYENVLAWPDEKRRALSFREI